MTGQLYGVGTGPGDPDLLTLQAAALVRECSLLCFINNGRGESRARAVVAELLAGRETPAEEYPLVLPMCRDRSVAEAAYDSAAEHIAAALEADRSVVFLCEGDPLLFGSFNYLHERLAGRFPVRVVPGISALSAAAAALGRPLARQAESLALLSGRHSDARILAALEQHDGVVLYKAGAERDRLSRLIKQSGRIGDGAYVEQLGRPDERLVADLNQLEPGPGPYFSLFLITRHAPPPDDIESPLTRGDKGGLESPPNARLFTLSEAGQRLAGTLLPLLPGAVHHHRPEHFADLAREAFDAKQPLLFVCASGIVLRVLGPRLSDKRTEPPVLVLDDGGRFVIPLLGSHEAGASAWAAALARQIGAQAVLTGATDYSAPVHTLGLGCIRGCAPDKIEALLGEARARLNPFPEIAAIASLDLKADEAALQDLAAKLELPFHTYPATQLRQWDAMLETPSAAVEREVGCRGVAEAAALESARQLAGNTPELCLSKIKNAAATLAIARAYPSFGTTDG